MKLSSKAIIALAIAATAMASLAATSNSDLAWQYVRKLNLHLATPDRTDYSEQFYYHNYLATLQARDEMPWGKSVPERELEHFVLPVRVNNENLDTARIVFYRELRDRVKNLSMEDAILEVNHWCHEKVSYRPSDARTSSPLATMRTAYGRCGEESTRVADGTSWELASPSQCSTWGGSTRVPRAVCSCTPRWQATTTAPSKW